MSTCRIPVTGARRVPAGTGGLTKTSLNSHGCLLEKLLEKSISFLTHTIMSRYHITIDKSTS
jgi:hypothetical protein